MDTDITNTEHCLRIDTAWSKIMKRSFDILFSAVFLCTVFPVIFIIVYIVTKTTMPGKIFFIQKRSGINGKVFRCYKFRTMLENADSDNLQATRGDTRVTRWGHILRKTSIDETPQFINVLKGDMSIVGPRPHMIRQTIEYSSLIDGYMKRLHVKPGVTGWSQIHGYRGEIRQLSDMENRVRYDIWYIRHWSFRLDLFIIFNTATKCLYGDENAY